MAEYIDESAVLQRALDTYGSTLQIVVTMEEMSELQNRESSETWVLNRAKLILGIEMVVMNGHGWDWFDDEGKLDIFNIDAVQADTMVQFALFGEVAFS